MRSNIRFADHHLPAFSANWRWFLVLGLVLSLLGLAAIWASVFTTIVTVIFLGGLLLFAGVVVLADTFVFWRGKSAGFAMHLLLALLYLIAGWLLIVHPVLGSISLTLLLGILYIILGVFRIGFSATLQAPRWGWSWFNGIITLILGVLIVISWPLSSAYIIGLFVGIDLLVLGWAYLMMGFAAKGMHG